MVRFNYVCTQSSGTQPGQIVINLSPLWLGIHCRIAVASETSHAWWYWWSSPPARFHIHPSSIVRYQLLNTDADQLLSTPVLVAWWYKSLIASCDRSIADPWLYSFFLVRSIRIPSIIVFLHSILWSHTSCQRFHLRVRSTNQIVFALNAPRTIQPFHHSLSALSTDQCYQHIYGTLVDKQSSSWCVSHTSSIESMGIIRIYSTM